MYPHVWARYLKGYIHASIVITINFVGTHM